MRFIPQVNIRAGWFTQLACLKLASCAFACLMLASASVCAQSIRLKDLAPTTVTRLDMQWAQFDPARGHADPAFHLLRAEVRHVPYQFDLSAYRGRYGRIELVVPASRNVSRPDALTVRWRGQGEIADGQTHSGGRYTVHAGQIDQGQWSFFVDFELLVDSRYFDGQLTFTPHFELTLDTR